MTFFDGCAFAFYLLVLIGIAAYFFSQYKQAVALGAKIQPLTPDDRLRISLALSSLTSAEKELGKVAWVGNLPGNHAVTSLHWRVQVLQSQMQALLRES